MLLEGRASAPVMQLSGEASQIRNALLLIAKLAPQVFIAGVHTFSAQAPLPQAFFPAGQRLAITVGDVVEALPVLFEATIVHDFVLLVICWTPKF